MSRSVAIEELTWLCVGDLPPLVACAICRRLFNVAEDDRCCIPVQLNKCQHISGMKCLSSWRRRSRGCCPVCHSQRRDSQKLEARSHAPVDMTEGNQVCMSPTFAFNPQSGAASELSPSDIPRLPIPPYITPYQPSSYTSEAALMSRQEHPNTCQPLGLRPAQPTQVRTDDYSMSGSQVNAGDEFSAWLPDTAMTFEQPLDFAQEQRYATSLGSDTGWPIQEVRSSGRGHTRAIMSRLRQ